MEDPDVRYRIDVRYIQPRTSSLDHTEFIKRVGRYLVEQIDREILESITITVEPAAELKSILIGLPREEKP